jgi:hypothetical protein
MARRPKEARNRNLHANSCRVSPAQPCGQEPVSFRLMGLRTPNPGHTAIYRQACDTDEEEEEISEKEKEKEKVCRRWSRLASLWRLQNRVPIKIIVSQRRDSICDQKTRKALTN